MLRIPKNGLSLQIAFASGISLFIVVLIIIVGFDTRNIANEIVNIRSEISMQKKQADQLAVLKEEAAKAEARQVKLENALPTKDELFSFPARITSIGNEAGVAASISFGAESSEAIAYTIIAQGGYVNLLDFVKKIEDILFINITSFEITQGDNGFDLNLKGSVFFNG